MRHSLVTKVQLQVIDLIDKARVQLREEADAAMLKLNKPNSAEEQAIYDQFIADNNDLSDAIYGLFVGS